MANKHFNAENETLSLVSNQSDRRNDKFNKLLTWVNCKIDWYMGLMSILWDIKAEISTIHGIKWQITQTYVENENNELDKLSISKVKFGLSNANLFIWYFETQSKQKLDNIWI